MKLASFTLRKLLFAGKELDDAWVTFDPGLNIIYGGSNAGKSFILRAIDFMLGADRLKLPKQGEQYDTIYLWLNLPDGTPATLQRATKGGNFRLHDKHVSPEEATTLEGVVLAPNQKGRGKKPSKNDSLSEYILRQIGIRSAMLVKNEAGQKAQLSIRLLSHYVFVGEDEMIGARSPIQIPDQRMSSLDKSLFRFILTGSDDSAIVEVPNGERLAASRDGKIEILTEMLYTLDLDIAYNDTEKDLITQLATVSETVATIQGKVGEHQLRLDELRAERRHFLGDKSANEFKITELRLMLSRFEELKAVYESDIDRLTALEEGGFLLQRFSDLPCALCGAEAIHQHKSHGLEDVELQRRAADSEIAKIRMDLADLKPIMSSLKVEVIGFERHLHKFELRIDELEIEIGTLLPQEKDVRACYEQAIVTKTDVANRLGLIKRKLEFQTKIQELQKLKIGRQRAEGLSVGISASIAYEFSQTVKEVLNAWRYPDMGEVHFDPKTQDIVVNGRERTDNGKGIRAILHSAFKVAVLIFCRNKELPHPGFVVLDSPLLTYRGPLQRQKHGELAEDEARFQRTTLNKHFYDHLASLSSIGQIIVLENQDPPAKIQGKANVVIFSGERGWGRQGFFPSLI